MAILVGITEERIVLDDLVRAVSDAENGGIVAFLGVVRRHNDGREVEWLEYEAYKEVAEAKMREIAAEVEQRWQTRSIAMIHRIGHLEIGEAAVGVAVGTAHRAEAFDACEYAIDTLKAIVPVWKKESYEAGDAAWVVNRESNV